LGGTKYGYVTRNKACLRHVTQGSTPSVKSGQESDTIFKHIRFSVLQYGKSRVTNRCSLSTGRRDSLVSNTDTIFKHITFTGRGEVERTKKRVSIWRLSPVMVSGADCKFVVLVPSLFESESLHQV